MSVSWESYLLPDASKGLLFVFMRLEGLTTAWPRDTAFDLIAWPSFIFIILAEHELGTLFHRVFKGEWIKECPAEDINL